LTHAEHRIGKSCASVVGDVAQSIGKDILWVADVLTHVQGHPCFGLSGQVERRYIQYSSGGGRSECRTFKRETGGRKRQQAKRKCTVDSSHGLPLAIVTDNTAQ
jgi:hypothetical protein